MPLDLTPEDKVRFAENERDAWKQESDRIYQQFVEERKTRTRYFETIEALAKALMCPSLENNKKALEALHETFPAWDQAHREA